MAEVYATDPCCSFLALTIRADNEEAEATPSENDEEEAAVDDTGAVVADEGRQATSFDVEYDNNNDSIQDRIIAVANYKRLPSQKSAWIEAVRTHPSYRNRGLATIMLRSIVDVALSEENTVMQEEDSRDTMAMQDDIPPPSPPVAVPPNTRLLTCTIQSNQSMIRALTKSGFNQCNTIPILQFSTLTNLPGWKQNCQLVAQPLLHALELTHLVSPIAKALSSSSSWTVLSNEQQLIECLQLCKEEGGCSGYLPGLYEYIIPGPNRLDLQTSLQSGLVLAFDGEEASTTATTSTNTTAMEIGRAILVLTQDERISSLKSKWVCSIVAYTRHAFEAALWMAHSDTIARLMMHHSSHGCQNEKENDDEKKEDEDFVVATQQFCLVFDDAVPLEEGTLAHALPRVTDECIVFSYGGHP